jgi:hypothetical protein
MRLISQSTDRSSSHHLFVGRAVVGCDGCWKKSRGAIAYGERLAYRGPEEAHYRARLRSPYFYLVLEHLDGGKIPSFSLEQISAYANTSIDRILSY